MKDSLSKKDIDYVNGFNDCKAQGCSEENIVKPSNVKRENGGSYQALLLTNGAELHWRNLQESVIPVTVKKSLLDSYKSLLEENEEESLKERQFSKVLELSPGMIIITDRFGEFEYANPVFLNTVGYSLDEVVGCGPDFLCSNMTSSGKLCELKEAILKGIPWKGELKKYKKDGTKCIFSASLSPIKNNDGLITNFIIVGQDVTSFRNANEKLKKALVDKNVLLSELHHRVKNNLAVVSGLMQLQAFNEEDQIIKNKLLSSVGRIKAMSSMHEFLYESKSLKRIKFDSVIKRVVQHISGFYTKGKSIKIKWNLEETDLNINQAHPLTLIIYEVISNAYKHAFIYKKDGLIDIKLKCRGGLVFVSISDDGKGMPMDYHKIGKIESTTGYELLNSLINQLGGHFSYESDKFGTNFFLQFEKEDSKGISNAQFID